MSHRLQSVHWPVIRTALRGPLRVAAIDDSRTYRRLDVLIAALNLASDVRRICRTDTIGLLLPTSGAFPIAALAGWFAGKTVVPLNYLLKPEELQYVVADCGTDTILTVQPMLDYLERPPHVSRLVRLEDLTLRTVPEPEIPAFAGPHDLAVLLYTSGTSGRPKGVMLTHRNLCANVSQIRHWVHFGPEDTLIGVLPQFHSFGLTVLTLIPFSIGCRVVYTARFVPQRMIRLFREHRPTVFVGIPSMYAALLSVKDAGPDDFTSFRYLVSGGEPLPDDVARRFKERFGVTINEGFGLTETAPVTHWCRPHEYKPHSVGRPLPGVHQRIVDINTGEDLPPGAEGEIRLKGPNIMKGYYRLPEETAAAFDERGWFRTGDIGRVDEDGHLYITGRLKEMLIVGGENVFPREIEEVLNSHPAVKASAVLGETDPIRGEVPVAFVELEDGQGFDEKALITHCRQHLAGYKAPRWIRHLDTLPRNPTGKILRRELKSLVSACPASGPQAPGA